MRFILPSGTRLPEYRTDQPGSTLLVRTVSRHADRTPRRMTIAVSPALTGGDEEAARSLARDLDRRGYLPPDRPMTRAQLDAASAEHRMTDTVRALIWMALGEGVPLGTAMERAGITPAKRRNLRRTVERTIRAIGWGEG